MLGIAVDRIKLSQITGVQLSVKNAASKSSHIKYAKIDIPISLVYKFYESNTQ